AGTRARCDEEQATAASAAAGRLRRICGKAAHPEAGTASGASVPNGRPGAQGPTALSPLAMRSTRRLPADRPVVSDGYAAKPHILTPAPQAVPQCQTGGRVLKDRRLSRLLR